MKIEFEYTAEKTVHFKIETCAYNSETVFVIYEDGEIRKMYNSLILVLQYFYNTYGQETMEEVKDYFQ